jgi:hypothetical protein
MSRFVVSMEDGRDFVTGLKSDNSRYNGKGPDSDADLWRKLVEEGKSSAYCRRRLRNLDFDDELGHTGR